MFNGEKSSPDSLFFAFLAELSSYMNGKSDWKKENAEKLTEERVLATEGADNIMRSYVK